MHFIGDQLAIPRHYAVWAAFIKPLQIALLMITGSLILVGGCHRPDTNTPATEDATLEDATAPIDPLSSAQAAFDRGDYDLASSLLRSCMIAQPDDVETIWLAARAEAKRDNLSRALDLAETITESDRPLQNDVIDFCVQTASDLDDHRRYEQALRRSIAANPTQPKGYHRLWQHFIRHGRTFEAAQVADLLTDRGQANADQLESLIFRGQSYPRKFIGSEGEQTSQLSNHFEPGEGRARYYFSVGDFLSARKELESSLADNSSNPPINVASAKALLGRVLAELQADEDFLKWHSLRKPSWEVYDDYWFAVGSHHFDHGRYESAIHSLLQALRRNTADLVTYQRIQQSFKALQQNERSEAFAARAAIVNESRETLKSLGLDPGNDELAEKISGHLLELGRPLESLRWAERSLPKTASRQLAQIGQQRQRLRGVPGLRQMMAEDAMFNLVPSQFDLQPLATKGTKETDELSWSAKANANVDIRVRDVASEVGLEFKWYQGEEVDLSSIALYESLGGGVGVIDYDADGNPDLYFAQGSADPPELRGTRPNQLFRNLGKRFVAVEQQSQCDEFGYSQGISVGDVNQDGWPDLLVANIGLNRLFINCGDGTFRDATDQMHGQDKRFTSSMAIADINGDALPDLFEVNYIQLEGAFDPPQFDSQGRELLQGPLSQLPESDYWYCGDGRGKFVGSEIDESIAKAGTGLGIVITNIDGRVGNEVFVGNDARPNHLLTTKDGHWKDIASIQGVASGRFGLSTACMGIATGDFNRDGRFDMHVSNFINEYDNLFLQNEGGTFRDVAPSYQLPRFCSNNVGFGSKSLDLDRDGWLDVMTTNGHIFDQSHLDEPFRQKPLLIHCCKDRFERARVSASSDYFSQEHLGRGLAKLDWNQDGRVDFVVTHLDRPTALLELDTDTIGRGLQLELIGVQSERDAIGTRVTIKAAHGSLVDWVTAGDGYLCTDEALLDFGLADCDRVDEIRVQWPSGATQTFRDIATGRRYLIVENDSVLHQR